MIADRENTSKINLYTIAWHGEYSNARWKALGAHEDNPTLGTHFVLQMTSVPEDYPVDSNAEVWEYTPVKTRQDYVPPDQSMYENIVFGPVNAFEFNKANTGQGNFDNIPQKMGSFPDDEAKNKPDDTAYFLIRVWDTVSPRSDYTTNEKWVNDQLYDAVVVGMNVYNNDIMRPTARLYDLNPYTEIATVNDNITQENREATIRNAADPVEVGANIARGGLFNTKTIRDIVKSGYIDPRWNSFALNPVNSDGRYVDYPNKVAGDSVNAGKMSDNVSGRIILRGQAWDDQLIDEISIQIGGQTAKTILRLVNGKMTTNGSYQAWAAEEMHWKNGHTVEWAYVWDTQADPSGRGAGGWPSSDVQVRVFVKDKNGSNGGLYSNNTGSGTGAGSTYIDRSADNNSTTFHNQVSVNIVPYIAGFERDPKFSSKRSLQGWYSFYQGEPNIAIIGYNFGQDSSNVRVNLSPDGGMGLNITPAYTAANVTTVPENIRGRFSFTMPATAASGSLHAYVNGVAAWNYTSSQTNQSWNKDYNIFAQGTDLWINRPHAHVWRTIQQDSAPKTYMGGTAMGLGNPDMAMEYAPGGSPGRLVGMWNLFTNAAYTYMGSNKPNSIKVEGMQDHDSVNLNNVRGSNGAYELVSYDNGSKFAIGTNPYRDFSDMPQLTPGSLMVLGMPPERRGDRNYDPYTPLTPGAVKVYLDGINYNAYNAEGLNVASVDYIEQYWLGGHYNFGGASGGTSAYTGGGWKNVRVSIGGTNRRYISGYSARGGNLVYFGAFDRPSSEKSYLFMYEYYSPSMGWQQSVGENTYNTIGAQRVMVIDGGNNSGDIVYDSGEYVFEYRNGFGPLPQINATVPNISNNGIARSSNAGEFNAIDYDNTGPIIAYYDGANDTVRVALASSSDPAMVNWTRYYLLPEGHALRKGSGKYISMKVDAYQGIHIAFYNNVYNTVVYYYASNRNNIGNAPNGGNVKAHTVDSVVTGNGFWTDVKVDNNTNPYIVYSDISRSDNYDGVRVAYKSATSPANIFTGANTCPVTGESISGWEAVSMPANYRVNNDRLNIEVWPPAVRGGTLGTRPTTPAAEQWDAAIGYAGSDMFRIGYFYAPKWKNY
jgi:hypothetical protein